MKRKSGQTVIEFAFVSVIFIFMLVLTFNAILAFCVHQYISYAVFMSARSFQASADTPQQQVNNARETLASLIPGLSANQIGNSMNVPVYFKKFSERKALARIKQVVIPQPREGSFGINATSTVMVRFDVPFAELPLGNEVAQAYAAIELVAQSALGREVSARECRRFFFDKYIEVVQPIQKAGAPGLQGFSPSFTEGGGGSLTDVNSLWQNMEDNGC